MKKLAKIIGNIFIILSCFTLFVAFINTFEPLILKNEFSEIQWLSKNITNKLWIKSIAGLIVGALLLHYSRPTKKI